MFKTQLFNFVTFRGKEIIFIDERIQLNDRIPGPYYCDIRTDDGEHLPCTIEERVVVNHYGTIISKYPLINKDNKIIVLTKEEMWMFLNTNHPNKLTFKEYFDR